MKLRFSYFTQCKNIRKCCGFSFVLVLKFDLKNLSPEMNTLANIKNSYRENYNQMNILHTYVLLRNSLVFVHCCLTRDSNSAGVTGRPDANSLSPSTNLISENLKKVIKQLLVTINGITWIIIAIFASDNIICTGGKIHDYWIYDKPWVSLHVVAGLSIYSTGKKN